MADSELIYLSATQALERFRTRALSPVELMQAVIDRAARVEQVVNAFADTYFDEALAKARQAEERYLKGRPRALEGLPLAVKDDTAIEGRRTTTGSLIYRDHVDTETNPSVERLMRAGAIVHARTTCPEFCWAWVCYARSFGVTRNPWNPAYTPGGSSGGSAAALAAGTTPLATGTDSAGSIRVPAGMCGVVGYKPPYGRNPQSAPMNLNPYNQIGPMARTVADCALMQSVMSGPHPHDHATIRPKQRIPSPLKDIQGFKIAYSIDLDCFEVDARVRRNTLDALAALGEAGAAVSEVSVPWAREAIAAAHVHSDFMSAEMFARAVSEHKDLLADYTHYYASTVGKATRTEFCRALEAAAHAWMPLGTLLGEYDAFVCPTVATHEIPAEMPPWQEGFTINGKPVDADRGWVMTILFNIFSRCPVLAVPSGFTDKGLPTGIQVAARPFDDSRVFRIAAALERVRPWLDAPERRPRLAAAP